MSPLKKLREGAMKIWINIHHGRRLAIRELDQALTRRCERKRYNLPAVYFAVDKLSVRRKGALLDPGEYRPVADLDLGGPRSGRALGLKLDIVAEHYDLGRSDPKRDAPRKVRGA